MGTKVNYLLVLEQALIALRQRLPFDHPDIVKAQINIGITLNRMGLYKEAFAELKVAADRADLTTRGAANANLARALYEIGVALCGTRDYVAALPHAKRAIDMYKTLGAIEPIAMALQGMGNALYGMGREREAESKFQLAREYNHCVVHGIHPSALAARYLTNGDAAFANIDYERAAAHYEHGLAIYTELGNHKDTAEMGRATCKIGDAYCAKGSPGLGLQCYEAALKIYLALTIGDNQTVADTYYRVADAWSRLRNPTMANQCTQKGQQIEARLCGMVAAQSTSWAASVADQSGQVMSYG